MTRRPPPVARRISIRRSLLSNMLLLVALFAGAVLLATVMGADSLAKAISRALIGQTIERSAAEVRAFFSPVERGVRLLGEWTANGNINPANGDGAESQLLPWLKQHPHLFGAIVVDPAGHTAIISRLGNDWELRLVDPDTPGQLQQRYPLAGGPWARLEPGLDIASRPWYQAAQVSAPGEIVWTNAYEFFASGQPGLTAALRVPGTDGDYVVALDVLLEDISEFTRNVDVGFDGMVIITDSIGQTIGLPKLPRYASPGARTRAFLKQPAELGFQLAQDAAEAFRPDPQGSVRLEPVRFLSEGNAWWGQGAWLPAGSNNELFIGVIVPESQLLGTIWQLRVLIISVTVAVLLLAILRAIALARRYSTPIRALAEQSQRISTGDLEAQAKVESTLEEVIHLAHAHEEMRVALKSLLKLEDDLQLAREIQQKTFPQSFPQTRAIEIAAESEPAEQTGGDTFDVAGTRLQGEAHAVVQVDPERIHFLLADATGHGVGPSLTASQVRAMFRMGVRSGAPLQQLGQDVNTQLCEDLHSGRFVTAWLAEFDVARATLSWLSAGQAPLLHLHASTGEIETLSASAPPLGVVPGNEAEVRLTPLAQGDVFAVLSDGVFDVRNRAGEALGAERVGAILRDHAGRSAGEILGALKKAVAQHLDGTHAADDLTAIVLRRPGK